jgi:nucleotide-binding universal stress UspA family protein
MKGYKKILIAVNESLEVLRHGLRLASDESCWVTIVKVVPPYDGDLNLVGIRNIREVLNSGSEKAADAIRNAAEAERGLVKTRIEEGRIHEKIVEVAEDERCDLIVMGRRNRKGLMKFIGNNVITKVLRTAPCPVLVVEA